MGPGTKFPTLGQITYDDLSASYEELAYGLLEGGVDLLLIETMFDLLSGKAAIAACHRAMARHGRVVPIQAQVTIELTGRMLPGTEIGAALAALSPLGVDVLGLNCATGPVEMYEPLRTLSDNAPMPLSCMPNAGLPSVVDGHMHYDLTPEALAEHLSRFVTECGVQVVGGCCGTTPEHLRQVVEAIRPLSAAKRSPVPEPAVTSIYSAVSYQQDRSVLLVGERTNANGSKKFREAMLEGDWDTCVDIGREQIKEGAHVIDVCVDYTGADGVSDMNEVMSRLATQSSVPIMIDTTEAPVARQALTWLGGKAMLNSVNLEEGDAVGTRLDSFLTLAAEFGAAVVATCIDEEGQARTAEWKVRAARAITDLAVSRYGLDAHDIFIDTLALPLSTGMVESRRDGIETLEAIRRVKAELPGVRTILGLSNISFGLNPAARQVLNSVFLHEAAEAGLDAAIVHASKILPLHRIDEEARQVCLDLIYDRRHEGYDPLSELLAPLRGQVDVDEPGTFTRRSAAQRAPQATHHRRRARRPRERSERGVGWRREAPRHRQRHPARRHARCGRSLCEWRDAAALRAPERRNHEVRGVLSRALMEKSDQGGRGRVVLATVKGDVHDIGKNLVDIILTNNGYEVINLGIKVGVNEMLNAVEEHGADALGMSGLLVKSTLIMRENLEIMNERQMTNVPVLLGGAALTRTYVERDLREIYQGRLFYGKDAFEGLRVLDQLGEIRRGGPDDTNFGREISTKNVQRRFREERPASTTEQPRRSPDVETDNPLFAPPFLGSRVAKGMSLDEIAEFLNLTALFRNQWGFRPENGEDDAAFKERVSATLREQMSLAKADDLLVPQVVWGHYPAAADGNDLVIFADDSRDEEVTRFHFPRQAESPFLCIADFFRPVDSPDHDYASFMLVTMGNRISERAHQLFSENRYTDYLMLHGLGVEMAEALAEMWHKRIREELGYVGEDGPTLTGLFRQQYRGGRYSWGYPACPDLTDNAKVANLLESERIGVSVSEGFQLHPEQTTDAIICHHPKAKYFIA